MTRPRALPVHLTALAVLAAGLASLASFDPFKEGVWGGMATHLMQARSLARDLDLRYARRDIDRWFRDPPRGQGPRGLFLKRDARGRYYYAVPFLYALAGAPFVRLVGDRGLLVLNAGLLALLVWMLGRYWRRGGAGPWRAALFAAAVVGLSLAPAYLFVMEPALFRAALAGGAVALLVPPPGPPGRLRGGRHRLAGPLLGAALLGLAAYEMPVLLVTVPALLLPARRRRDGLRTGLLALCVLLAWSVPACVHLFQDGTVSPLLGDRREYVRGEYPLTGRREAFRAGPAEETPLADGGLPRRASLLPAAGLGPTFSAALRNLPLNLGYALAGRQAGLVPYAPGLLACFLVFLLSPGRRRRLGLLAALLAVGLFYLLFHPNDYFGGGPTLGNRHLLHLFVPAALLAGGLPRGRRFAALLGGMALAAAVFLNPVMRRPRYAVLGRRNRMKQPALAWLPLEMTQGPALFASPREAIALPGKARLYLFSGARRSARLGLAARPNHTLRLVLEAPAPMYEVRLRATAGPKGAVLAGRGAAAGWSTSLFPGASREIRIPLRGGLTYHTPAGARWAVEFLLRATLPGRAGDGRIALALDSPRPPGDFAPPPGGVLRLGRPESARHLLWGWSAPLGDEGEPACRRADEPASFLLFHLAAGSGWEVALEGRSPPSPGPAGPAPAIPVAVNGRPIPLLPAFAPRWTWRSFTIPASLLPAREVTTIRLDGKGVEYRTVRLTPLPPPAVPPGAGAGNGSG